MNFYYFSNVVGLNRVIIDKEEAVKDEDIESEVRERVEKIAGMDLEAFIWPKSNRDIPDNKKLKLIVLSHHFIAGDSSTQKFVQDLIDKYSTGFRTYKNTLLFLITDPNEYRGFKRSIRRLLALDAIKTDKKIMERLTEEDRERVRQKLKDADSSVSIRILSLYRHMAKASKDRTRTFDLGIPTVGEKLSLSSRAKEYLKDQEILLDQISPKVLFERTFSKDDERKSIVEVRDAFLKFPELPILEGEQVLRNAVVQGVENGIFGIQIGDKILYRQPVFSTEVSEEVVIVRREIAQKMKEEIGEVPTELEEEPPTRILGSKPPIGKEAIKKIAVRAKIPWDKLSELVRGVFTPLRREGAQISLEVKIEAQSDEGISRDILDLKVRETLKQIGAEVLEEKEE